MRAFETVSIQSQEHPTDCSAIFGGNRHGPQPPLVVVVVVGLP